MSERRGSGRSITGRVGSVRPVIHCAVVGLIAWLFATPATLAGQQATVRTGREISGRVIDSRTRDALQGATVLLYVVQADSADGSADRDPRLATTGTDGVYEFVDLPPARYRIEVSRIGYVGADLEIDLSDASLNRLAVGLEASPIVLAPIEVIGGRPEPYGRLQSTEAAQTGGLALVDQLRRERYLVSDTRELTHSEVMAAVTLAETDLFRALQRIPGVSTRDDYTATMWTRGATWDQTRVYFDGLPLFNPTHAGWLFSAVNPDVIASAAFHPGYRPARWGEGSAGVLDLQSRTGQPGPQVRGTAEISLASTRIALDGQLPGLSWMVAARRSYVDVLAAMVRGFVGDQDLRVPYDFTDFVGRADLELGRGWELEGSSIFEYDHLRGDIPSLLEGNRGRWGNRLARLSAIGPLGPVQANVTVGGTDFSTLIYEDEEGEEDEESAATLPTLENGIQHRLVSLEIQPISEGQVPDWQLGVQSMRDSVSYDGPFSLISVLATGVDRDSLEYGSKLAHTAVWGEKRWALGSAVDAVTGLRVEMGESVANGGQFRFAPRIALRAQATDRIALTGGWTRSFQYTQDVSPAAGPIGPQLHLSAVWLLATAAPAFPAVKADLATAGIEANWGAGWSFTGNVYDRRTTGLIIPNPTPGEAVTGRDPDSEAAGSAHGAELTLRRLAGRWTGSLGYTWGVSNMTSRPAGEQAPALEFPSSADIRHSFDATGLVRLGESLQLGGAFTFGSGVPFTRILIDGADTSAPPVLREPNALRTPVYASLDLMVEYERRYADWLISGYLQVRNVTNRSNTVTYAGSWNCPAVPPVSGPPAYLETCADSIGLTDRFERGLPLLPLIGLRIAF